MTYSYDYETGRWCVWSESGRLVASFRTPDGARHFIAQQPDA